MQPIDKLCAELYDYIIDFLHDDDDALRACALVCRAWLPSSRCHLFYHLKLSGSGPSPISSGWAQNTACRRIFATILSSPHLASYVNELSVQELNVVRPSTYRWVSSEITFPALLNKLSNIRALEFNFPPPGPETIKTAWSTMTFRDISEAMSSMSLETLALRQFSFSSLPDFVKILDSCHHLKTLQLDHVDIATATHLSPSALEHVLNLNSPDSISHTSKTKANLETLILRSNSSALIIPVLLHTHSFLDLSSLQKLVMNVAPDSYSNILEFLKFIPNLQHLELDIERDFDYDAHLEYKDTLDLTHLPALRYLSLHTHILLGRMELLPWLLAMFSTTGSANNLLDFSLTCTVDKPPPSVTVQAFDNVLVGWHDLDNLLTQPTFDAMRRFRLDFALDKPIGDETAKQMSQEFIKQLRNLQRKGSSSSLYLTATVSVLLTMHLQPTPTPHEQRLPQEIFDSIIDYFHSNTETLRVCALVSSAWLASARKHLFSRITLSPPKSAKTSFFFLRPTPSLWAQLFECIWSNGGSRLGSVVPYIRELHLHEGVIKREWLAHERALPSLLRSLANIRRLEISRAASVRIVWEHLRTSLKAALEDHALRLTSLTELKLSSFLFDSLEDLGKILRACRYLRVLEVDHVMFTDESLDRLVPGEEDGFASEKAEKIITSLDILVIGPRTSTAFLVFLLHATSPIAVGTIRKLSLSISGSFSEFSRLLHASTSVEHLELTLMNDGKIPFKSEIRMVADGCDLLIVDLQEYWTLPDSQHFNLSQVPHLRNLKINIDVLQKMDDPLPWLGALLSTGKHASHPTRRNTVETIYIAYSIYLPAPYMDRSMNTAIFDRWREIDTILCGVESTHAESEGHAHAYETLKRVKLEFMLENPIGFGVAPRFLKELVLDSPGLERRDVLRVNAFDTSK
ncbi:hypothetical protein CVT25_010305 [Psilocybe cyanescens]|uniref:F-box domain-containing protein n=1 Tax=Psilocybe cyanescens TaxID=93625 RepID=A0A409VNS4_PSICY|nr:hypothetical protein CVT25_010305 [Psilocybe cyanescens]